MAERQLRVAWDPNTEPDLAGYKLHIGTASRSYDRIIDVGDVTTVLVGEFNEGETYYFALTAYDTSKNESSYSPELEYTVGITQDTTPPMHPRGLRIVEEVF